MSKFLLALFLLVSTVAAAAPLADTDKTALAGEWRSSPGCAKTGARFELEFAVTGGQIFIDDPATRRTIATVQSTEADGAALTLAFQDKTSWSFERAGKDTLVSAEPPHIFAGLKGATFHRCRPPADRSALKIAQDAINFFSVMMPPDYPTFIDAHAKDGCKASAYSFVSIDLVGPEQFAITRGTISQAAKGAPPKLAQIATWSIDAAEELPNVARLTITPLTGPDHARGTPTKISLVAGEDASLLTIPEWDAVYRRCTIRELGPD